MFLMLLAGGCFLSSCTVTGQPEELRKRVADRDYPSAFMAWYNIDHPDYPVGTEEERIAACAKHDLMWEEPLSQLGEGVDLVLGLVWDNKHHGLATSFTPESLERARTNKKLLLEKNPRMICLFEIRWRDAPMSFLPPDSDWWLRDSQGGIRKGWLGGWEPFYLLGLYQRGTLGQHSPSG